MGSSSVIILHFNFCLVSVPVLFSTLRVPNGTKLKVCKYFYTLSLRFVVFLFYAQIMPCGTYLDARKIINIEACYENSVLPNFTLCPGGTVGQEVHLVTR